MHEFGKYDEEKEKELEALRKKADQLGIEYHHRAGAKTIRKLIAQRAGMSEDAVEKLVSEEPVPEDDSEDLLEEPDPEKNVVDLQSLMMNPEEAERILEHNKRNEINKLVRVNIQCMNPFKKEWPGEIISVGSAKMGTFKKYIPFNSDQPYHIPKIILDELKTRKCTVFTTKTLSNGQKVRKGKLINEFAIEELPPLSHTEIKELAQRQAMAAGSAEV